MKDMGNLGWQRLCKPPFSCALGVRIGLRKSVGSLDWSLIQCGSNDEDDARVREGETLPLPCPAVCWRAKTGASVYQLLVPTRQLSIEDSLWVLAPPC